MKVGKMQLLINGQTREAIEKLYQVALLINNTLQPNCFNKLFDCSIRVYQFTFCDVTKALEKCLPIKCPA